MTTTTPNAAPAASDAELQAAFQAGRDDERRRAPRRAALAERRTDKAWREAYDRGRRDERARRPALSLVSVALVVAAVVGGGIVFLAAREGSFSRGGALVDQQISTAGQQAQAPIKAAAAKAGNALENAGANLKAQAGDQPEPFPAETEPRSRQ